MNIRDVGKTAVVDIAGKAISRDVLGKIKKLLDTINLGKRVAINLSKVEYIDCDFINLLKEYSEENKISLFGLNNDVYLLLFISKADSFVNMYLDEDDFLRDKNTIVYRRLKLLKIA